MASGVDALVEAVSDVKLLVAVVGVAGTVLGAAAASMFKARFDLSQERRLRHQRQIDLLVAIHAEILAGVGASGWQVTQSEYEYAVTNRTPFATPDDNDFVFRSALDELTLLPAPVIHSIVEYYRLAAQSNDLTRDLRTPEFARQTQEEREKFVVGLMTVIHLQRVAGELAVSDIERHLQNSNLQARRESFLKRRDTAVKRFQQRGRTSVLPAEAAPSPASHDGNDRAAHDVSPREPNISNRPAE